MYTQPHTHTYVHIYVHTFAYVCTYVYIHIFIHTHISVYTNIYTHTCTKIHTHSRFNMHGDFLCVRHGTQTLQPTYMQHEYTYTYMYVTLLSLFFMTQNSFLYQSSNLHNHICVRTWMYFLPCGKNETTPVWIHIQ